MKKIFYLFVISVLFLFSSCENLLLIEATQLYEVSFESNGGTPIESYRTNCIEKSPVVTKEDVIFSGWYETSDFKGEPVQFPYYISENKNFYAKWNKICHVSFETNGGSEVSEMDTDIINTAPESSRTGYILLGWYKEAELQNQISFPYELSNDVVFYAKWTVATNTLYKVEHYKQISVLESNLDSYALCDSETMAGKTDSLTQAASKTYEGFTAKVFSQVPIAADGSTVIRVYYDKNKYTVAYKVRHYKQTTSLGPNYELAEEDNLTGMIGTTTFASAKAYCGFTEKSFSQSIIDESGNTIVNIYYDRNKYSVTFNANSGTGTMSTQTFYYGVKQKIRSCTFSNSNYTFSGWAETTNGSIKYKNNEEIIIEKNTTLYAKWFYGTTITNADIANLDFSALTEDYTLRVTGQISHSTLEELANKITLAKVNITLDLSATQGLVTIGPNSNNNSIFSNCKKLTSIILPDSLTTIGSYAFYNCKSLTQISIPTSIKTIGSYAFYFCENLTSINLDGVETIGRYAFGYNSNLSSIILQNINKIDVFAFSFCTSLTSITIDAVIIGMSAFYGCSILTEVIIGKRVTEIQNTYTANTAYCVFKNCPALTSISFEDNETWYVKYSDSYSYTIDVSKAATNASNLQYAEKPWIKK